MKIQIDDADWIKGKEMSRTRFVNKLIEATGNVLLEKIWQTLLNFENTFKRENDSISIEQCKKLLNAIHHVDTKQAISIYMNFFDQQTKQGFDDIISKDLQIFISKIGKITLRNKSLFIIFI